MGAAALRSCYTSTVVRLSACVSLLALLATGCSSSADDDSVDVTSEAQGGVDETALDRNVDPCTDFYAFACGGYDANALPAGTEENIRSTTLLAKAQESVLLRVLERLRNAPQSAAETKAGTFYRRCLEDDESGKAATLHGIRDELATVRTEADLAKAIGAQVARAYSPIFQITTTFGGRRAALVAFATPELPTPAPTLAADVKAAILFHEPAFADPDATAIGEAYARVSERLASEMATAVPSDTPETKGLASLQTFAPHIDWATFFTSIGVDAPSNDFEVFDPSTFAAIDRAIASLPASDVAFFLVGAMYRRVPKAVTPALEGYCRALTLGALPDAVQRAYLEYSGFGDDARNEVQTLFDAIRSAFADAIRENTWLDEPTRAAALAKLNAMEVLIGGPEDNDDYASLALEPTDDFFAMQLATRAHVFRRGLSRLGKVLASTELGKPATTINASYDLARNRVYIPAAIFGEVTFSNGSSSFANFAALGALLGHEITHGFDSEGRFYDDTGLVHDWWSTQSSDAFDERASCFVGQYSAFTVTGAADPVTGETPAHVDGENTLAENIADNSGIKAAYRASKVDAKKTPIHAGFAPAQQFFLAYAQQHCGRREGEALESIITDVHAPEKARVNVPLQNFAKFADAFQCKAGAPMVIADRCDLW